MFRLDANDRNFAALWEMFAGINREPLIAQKFLPDVAQGDKRVILVDGEPVGAINRVPQDGETRSNMHAGGTPMKVGLTDRDREICAAIGPLLREKGQVFVGIDVIGGWLTEINVTSPTGLRELERFDGVNVTAKIWEAIERRRGRMSWRLVALNLVLRFREKPYLARETDFARGRARMEREARAFPMPARTPAPRDAPLGGAARRCASAGPDGGAGDPVAARRGLLPRIAPHPCGDGRGAGATRAGAGAVLPDYRLAPEHRFPAPRRRRAGRLGCADGRGRGPGPGRSRRRQRRRRACVRAAARPALRGAAGAGARWSRSVPGPT